MIQNYQFYVYLIKIVINLKLFHELLFVVIQNSLKAYYTSNLIINLQIQIYYLKRKTSISPIGLF